MAIYQRGPAATRPTAPNAPATFFLATDTQELWYSDGSQWDKPTEGPLVAQIVSGPTGEPGPPGTTAWDDLTGKPATFAPSPHAHPQSEVTNLVTDLAAKAPASHTHPASDITGLPAADTNLTLTADLAASTTTTLANTTGLSFAVTSGVTYRFRALIVFRTAALTTGIKLGVTTPAFTVFTGNCSIPFAADGAGGIWHGFLTTSGDSVTSTGVPAINTDLLAVMDGLIVPSANGTVQVQHATEVAASAATIRRGSTLSYKAL